MTPPRRIILSKFVAHSKEAIAHLVRYLLETEASIPGVVGPASEAQAFSACWAEAVPSAAPKETMRMRVFEARTVADVPLSEGTLRLASMDDHPLMAQWMDGFSQEALGEPADLDKAKESAARFIADRQLYILGLQWADLHCQNDAPDAKRHNRHPRCTRRPSSATRDTPLRASRR